MSEPAFQFTAAAKLYAQHAAISDIVEEMRQETYRSIVEFRDRLLTALAREAKPARLGNRATTTQGKWAGGEIQYVWFGEDPAREWKKKVPMAYFACPLPDKVKEERSWRGTLALVSDGVLTLDVTSWAKGGAKQLLSQISAAGLEAELGKDTVRVKVKCSPEDPVGSAARGVGSLLRVLAAAREGA